MVKTIILNSTNVLPGTNNSVYRYSFPTGQIQFKDGDRIAVQSIFVPYSWFNVSTQYNNTSFQYIWHTSGAPVSYTVNLPSPSFITITDINNLLQSVMIQNGHYLVNAVGEYVYYAEVVLNQSRYAYQINTYPLPQSLPQNWTNPANLALGITTNPQIVIQNNNFGKLIGFLPGTYSPTLINQNYSALSNTTPNATEVNSVLLLCNILDNKFSIPSKLLYAFSPNASFGNNISIIPSEFAYNDITAGYYSSIDIEFRDQDNRPMILQDSNLVLQLVIKSAGEE